MIPNERTPLPALDNAPKVKKPDLPDISDKNYTDTILRYGGLATKFPQLNTNAKTVVAAINELQAGGGGDGKHRTLTQAEYDALTEEEKMDGTIYFITDADSGGGGATELSQLDDVYIDKTQLDSSHIYRLTAHYDENTDSLIWQPQFNDFESIYDSTIYFHSTGSFPYYTGVEITEERPTQWAFTPGKDDGLSSGNILMWDDDSSAWAIGDVTNLLNSRFTADAGNILYYNGYDWVVTYNEPPNTGEVLTWNGDSWYPAPYTVEGLSSIVTPTTGQLIYYDGQRWTQTSDVSSPVEGEILTWDEYNACWTNARHIKFSFPYDLIDGQVLTYDYNTESWVNTTFSLNNLSDCDTEYPSSGDVLTFDGERWVPQAPGGGDVSELGDLSDVNIYYPTDGEVLTYQNGEWVNSSGSNVSSLDDLSDVNISSAQSGQVLKYNGTDWVNATEGDLSNYYTKSETDTLLDAKADISDVPNAIQDLDNVTISGASNGQVLKYDGTDWVNANESTGSTVTVTQIQSTGTKIATIGVDGVNTDLYSPNGGGTPSALNDLTDVTITTPTNGQVLTYTNGDWVNSNATGGVTDLSDLDDVNISSALDGQVLTYDSTTDTWVNETLPAIPDEISDLSDVTISSVTNGQVLKYNNGNWVNANESGGSTVAVTQIQSTGTKIATITVDSVGTDLYAPTKSTPRLDDLADVSISSVTDGQVLAYDGNSGEWVNESLPSIPKDITDLSDVSVTSASNGQVLKYNNGIWENVNESTGSTVSVTQIQSTGTKIATITVDSVDTDLYTPNGGGGAVALDDLSDVDIDTTTLANHDELVYNSSTSQWENKQVTVTLTQAQYDALVNAGTVDPDVFYLITDASIVPWTDLTSTLTAGSTSIIFSNARITANSTIDVYTDSDIDYNSITVTTGQVVITFDAQVNNVSVKVRVS